MPPPPPLSWPTEESPEAQEPPMTNFATLAKFLPELNPSAEKKKEFDLGGLETKIKNNNYF